MKNYFKIVLIAFLVGMYGTGCASYMVFEGSRKKVAYKRVMASGNDVAIRAFRSGDVTGIGLNVDNLNALGERPFLQVGAAFLDALILYGGYEGIRSLNGSGIDSGDYIIVSGDNNEVNVIQCDSNSSNQDKTTDGDGSSNDIN